MNTRLKKVTIERAAALHCASLLVFLRSASLFETVVFTRHLAYCPFPLTRSSVPGGLLLGSSAYSGLVQNGHLVTAGWTRE